MTPAILRPPERCAATSAATLSVTSAQVATLIEAGPAQDYTSGANARGPRSGSTPQGENSLTLRIADRQVFAAQFGPKLES